MAQHIVDNPQVRSRDLPVDGAVDTTGGTGTADRPTSVKLFPFLASGVELATGFFNRFETRFVGVVDNFRVGNPVVALAAGPLSVLNAIAENTEDAVDVIREILSKMDLARSDVQSLTAWLKGNLDWIVNRNLGSIRDSAEESEDFLSLLLAKADALRVPLDRLAYLYYAYNFAVAAVQNIPVVASPKGVNGPAVLLSNVAQAEIAGTYFIDVPVSNYDLQTIQIYWAAFAGDTYQWDILARIDDLPAGDWVNVNAWFNVAGTALGGAANAGLSICRISTRTQIRELRLQRIKTNNNGVASIRTWVMEGR